MARIDDGEIARRPCLQNVVADGLTEMGDVPLEDIGGGLGRALAPELVDQCVAADHLIRPREEDRQERPLPCAAERNRTTVGEHLERAQNPELHAGLGWNVPRPPAFSQRRPSGHVHAGAMAQHLENEASAPGLGAESGPLQGVAGGPRASGHRARSPSYSPLGRVRIVGLACFLAGIALSAAVLLSVHLGPASAGSPAGLDRTWSTSEVSRYLGLGDASTFGGGIACQLYIEKKRPYTWVVSLCHH